MTEQFIQERKYLKAVSDKTLAWYKDSFKAFAGALDSTETINARIVEMRKRGVKPVSINTYLRCIKAYYLWQGKEWKVSRLKEEQKILATLTPAHVASLLNYRPKPPQTNLVRAHLVALTILDTGLRASEVLGLSKENVDFDNLVLKVVGKGKKDRLIPFSLELRKSLWRYSVKSIDTRYLFGTKNQTKVSVRNLERDFKVLGKKCAITGVRFSPHTLRHTMSTNWIRRGGDLFMLSRVLGHNNISTTARYLKSLGVEDIMETAQRVSLLSR